MGFSDYSVVIIENTTQNSATVQVDQFTTPTTFNNMCSNNQYVVLFEPGSAGQFSTALSTSTAGNIGYVAKNQVATGMSTGQTLNFNFSGLPNNYTGLAPSSLSITWYPPPIPLDLSQGLILGSYYTIAPGLPPFNFTIPSDMTLNNGYYIVGWSGYPASINIPAYQAWGVPTNNTTYVSFSPLISNGNFYPPAPTTSSSGGVITFYQGIPKMIYNIGFLPA
jgi:hypothetical protein